MVEAGVALPQLSSAILAEEVGAAVHKMMVEGVGSNNSRTAASAGAMHEQRPVQPQDVNVRRSASPPQQQQQQAPTSLPPISQLVSPLAMQSPAAVALQPQHQTHYAATTSSAYLQRAPVHDIPTTRLVSSTTTPFGFYANGHGNVPAYSGTAPTMLPEQHSESLPLRDSRPYAYVASSPYSPAMQNPFGYRFSSASTHMARPHSSSHFEVHLDLYACLIMLCAPCLLRTLAHGSPFSQHRVFHGSMLHVPAHLSRA